MTARLSDNCVPSVEIAETVGYGIELNNPNTWWVYPGNRINVESVSDKTSCYVSSLKTPLSSVTQLRQTSFPQSRQRSVFYCSFFHVRRRCASEMRELPHKNGVVTSSPMIPVTIHILKVRVHFVFKPSSGAFSSLTGISPLQKECVSMDLAMFVLLRPQ